MTRSHSVGDSLDFARVRGTLGSLLVFRPFFFHDHVSTDYAFPREDDYILHERTRQHECIRVLYAHVCVRARAWLYVRFYIRCVG